jgi:hypothetical protein
VDECLVDSLMVESVGGWIDIIKWVDGRIDGLDE